jgi:hypothetical protein
VRRWQIELLLSLEKIFHYAMVPEKLSLDVNKDAFVPDETASGCGCSSEHPLGIKARILDVQLVEVDVTKVESVRNSISKKFYLYLNLWQS